jgi:hypothetical protein
VVHPREASCTVCQTRANAARTGQGDLIGKGTESVERTDRRRFRSSVRRARGAHPDRGAAGLARARIDRRPASPKQGSGSRPEDRGLGRAFRARLSPHRSSTVRRTFATFPVRDGAGRDRPEGRTRREGHVIIRLTRAGIRPEMEAEAFGHLRRLSAGVGRPDGMEALFVGRRTAEKAARRALALGLVPPGPRRDAPRRHGRALRDDRRDLRRPRHARGVVRAVRVGRTGLLRESPMPAVRGRGRTSDPHGSAGRGRGSSGSPRREATG